MLLVVNSGAEKSKQTVFFLKWHFLTLVRRNNTPCLFRTSPAIRKCGTLFQKPRPGLTSSGCSLGRLEWCFKRGRVLAWVQGKAFVLGEGLYGHSEVQRSDGQMGRSFQGHISIQREGAWAGF